jgi:GxxExxY protein
VHIGDNKLKELEKRQYKEPSEELDKLAEIVARSALQVHTKLGPGLLERFYRDSLVIELKRRCVKVEKEVPIPVYYDDIRLEGYYVLDLLIEDKLVVELKTVDEMTDLHKAQLRTYLRISGRHLGLLINFNSTLIKTGIKRIINERYCGEV